MNKKPGNTSKNTLKACGAYFNILWMVRSVDGAVESQERNGDEKWLRGKLMWSDLA
jgi:hypothetical protein